MEGGYREGAELHRISQVKRVALPTGIVVRTPESPDFAVNCKLAAGSLDDLEPGDVLVLERGTESRFVGIRARANFFPDSRCCFRSDARTFCVGSLGTFVGH
jgi:hypothetical protein